MAKSSYLNVYLPWSINTTDLTTISLIFFLSFSIFNPKYVHYWSYMIYPIYTMHSPILAANPLTSEMAKYFRIVLNSLSRYCPATLGNSYPTSVLTSHYGLTNLSKINIQNCFYDGSFMQNLMEGGRQTCTCRNNLNDVGANIFLYNIFPTNFLFFLCYNFNHTWLIHFSSKIFGIYLLPKI